MKHNLIKFVTIHRQSHDCLNKKYIPQLIGAILTHTHIYIYRHQTRDCGLGFIGKMFTVGINRMRCFTLSVFIGSVLIVYISNSNRLLENTK